MQTHANASDTVRHAVASMQKPAAEYTYKIN